MVINRDVEFDEEGACWKVDDGEKYNFLPILNEKKKSYENHQEQATAPQSLMVSSLFLSFFSSGSSSSGSQSNQPRRMRIALMTYMR
jgi:hypothetical protein